jgi:hypothetical protein
MDTWTYVLLGAAGLFIMALYLRERRRSENIRALANRIGLHYLGRGVPQSLSLHGTPVERATSIWNVIDGDHSGTRVIAFDCQIGSGKQTWRRTVIAVKTENDELLSLNYDLSVDRSGDWKIIYQPKQFFFTPRGLMPLDDLEARLRTILS